MTSVIQVQLDDSWEQLSSQFSYTDFHEDKPTSLTVDSKQMLIGAVLTLGT